MVIFHSYVSLPEDHDIIYDFMQFFMKRKKYKQMQFYVIQLGI